MESPQPRGRQELESLRLAQKELLSNLRHDLRTPITHILGYSEMLEEEVEEQGWETFQQRLQTLQRAGTDLLNLVNTNLSDEAMEKEEINVNSIRQQMQDPLNIVIGYAGNMQEEAEDQGHAQLVSDFGRIATAADHILATVYYSAEFRSLESIGLAVHPIESSFDLSERTTIAPVASDREAISRAGAILVVEDDQMSRDLLSRRLQRVGYTIATAEDGDTALQMAGAGGHDLMLLDYKMPGMTGYEVLQRLKSDESMRNLPVIMISGLDDMESVVRCIEMGAEDYLLKPFNNVLLQARIDASLEKKRLRDAELEYLEGVATVSSAAAAVDAGNFDASTLAGTADRNDELGQLARVFQKMAREVQVREERLIQQVHALRIEVDEATRARQVAEITETDYFQQLRRRSQEMRHRAADPM